MLAPSRKPGLISRVVKGHPIIFKILTTVTRLEDQEGKKEEKNI